MNVRFIRSEFTRLPETRLSQSSSNYLKLDTLQRGVQWMGDAVDWGSIM